MDPRSVEANKRDRLLLRARQPTPSYFANPVNETFRRFLDSFNQAAVAPREPFAGTSSPPGVAVRTQPVIDRLHKESSHYVFVSNDHGKADPDPVPNPGYRSSSAAFSSIKDAYTYGRDTLAPSLTDGSRVTIFVIGGYYPESLTFDSPLVDVIGLQFPIIEGKVLILSTCTKINFANFEIINSASVDSPDERYAEYQPAVLANSGLSVYAGAESGTYLSDLVFQNLYIHGPNTQVYCERWAYFEKCRFHSETNLTALSGVNYPSVFICYAPITPPIKPAPTNWIHFKDCVLSGQNDTFTSGFGVSHPELNKGPALRITAIDPLGVRSDNDATALSGVYLQSCKIAGWTENWLWNLKHDHCHLVEGQYINDSSGSQHHLMYCYNGPAAEDPGIDTHTSYDHCEFDVRYISFSTGTSPSLGFPGKCFIWLREITHNGPDPTPAGAANISHLTILTLVQCYVSHSATPAASWYLGAPPAVIVNSNQGINPAIGTNLMYDLLP